MARGARRKRRRRAQRGAAERSRSGEHVYIWNAGIAHAIGGALYFRTSPRFETSSERLRWLLTSQFVATGTPRSGAVELDFFRVL